MNELLYYIEPSLLIVLKVLAVYFLYKIARNLRMILKEICHIGKKNKGE